MTVYRAPRDGSHGGWTAISNAIAEDRRLTPDGLALVVYLLTKPDHWQPNPTQLRERFGWGRDRWRRVLAEVESTGYVTRHQVRADGRIAAIGYDLHEVPLVAPGKAKVKAPKSGALKTKALKNKGLENKGLATKGLATKGLENKALEIHPLSNKGLLVRSTTTGEQAVEQPFVLTPKAPPDTQSAGRTGGPVSAPKTRPDPTPAPRPKKAASGPLRAADPIPAGWAPDPAVLEQLAGLGIDRDYALAAVPEFVRYWTDAGATTASWNAKFLRHIQSQWSRGRKQRQAAARAIAAQPGFIEKHTDPTWRNGL